MCMILTKIILLCVIVTLASIPSYAKKQETGAWSEPANGIQGRLFATEDPEFNGTKMVAIYLELRNVSHVANPLEIYFEPIKSIESRVLDGGDKPVAKYPSPASIGLTPPFWLTLPFDSTLRFRVSVSGYGVPQNGGTNIQMMSGNWLMKADDERDYFLEAAFVSQPAKLDSGRRLRRVWQGTIKLPKVLIPR